MNIHKTEWKNLLLLYATFWIFPIMAILIHLLFVKGNIYNDIEISHKVQFFDLLINNLKVIIFISLSGFFNKNIPFVLYLYNVISFGVIFCISLDKSGLYNTCIKTIPHGIFEVMALSFATFVGINIRRKYRKKCLAFYMVLSIFLIIISAYIESSI